MVEVKIRHIDELYGISIGEFNPSQIKPLENLFKNGLDVYHNPRNEVDTKPFDGARYYGNQFVIDEDGSHYEIIVQ